MKLKIFIAFLLFLLGLARIIDWIIFCSIEEYKILGWTEFKLKYYRRFPETLQPLLPKYQLLTFGCIACFVVAGIIFIKQRGRCFLF